jgi:DNA replication protein DnaC
LVEKRSPNVNSARLPLLLQTIAFPSGRTKAGLISLRNMAFKAHERDRSLRQPYKCGSRDCAQNVLLIGGPGTGKTRAATARGVQSADHHRRKVIFLSTTQLVSALEQENQ